MRNNKNNSIETHWSASEVYKTPIISQNNSRETAFYSTALKISRDPLPANCANVTCLRKNPSHQVIDYSKNEEDEMIETENEMIKDEDEEYAGIDYATKC